MNYQNDPIKIWLPDIVGGGYREFWNYKGRYRVCKGSRASKKSKTTALWFIYNMMKYPLANAIVIRKVYRTLKDSCYTELKWAANRLQVSHLWEFTLAPLEATYKPTGQKIYFRGLDDPLKVTSITVPHGYLCWAWLEEAYEVMREADFDIVDESIRGEVSSDLWKQVTITFNPWNDRHWLKKRFFDPKDDQDILAMTTNYMRNEWLDDADRKLFEDMKTRNPRRYKVAGLGDWGVTEGIIYDNWHEEAFSMGDIFKRKAMRTAYGLDFGYTLDPSALFIGYADEKSKELFVFDEMYAAGMSNERIYKKIEEMGYAKDLIVADSAEQKSIDRLRDLGIRRIKASRKGPDSVRNGIDFLQDWSMIIHPRCVNFITEISNYCYAKDKFDKPTGKPIDDFNHLMDAMRYGMEPIMRGELYSFD